MTSIRTGGTAYICHTLRTAFTKAQVGGFKDTTIEGMLYPLFRQLLKDIDLDPALVEDIAIGNVLDMGAAHYRSRIAALASGIPDATSIMAVNRQCGSALEAVVQMNNRIRLGEIDIAIGGGVESMTKCNFHEAIPKQDTLDQIVSSDEKLKNILIEMGQMSELVAQECGLTREDLDDYCYTQNEKTVQALKNNYLSEEICPIETPNGVISKDECIKLGLKKSLLPKLKPVFRKDGVTTAYTGSPMSDGASAVLLASEAAVAAHNLTPMARITSYAVAGIAPDRSGLGPIKAIPKLLKQNPHINPDDIDLIEIHEAFTSTSLGWIKILGLNKDIVNVNGGSVGMGHPLGATGGRLIGSIIRELKRRGKKNGLVSLCIGTGMGNAALIELV